MAAAAFRTLENRIQRVLLKQLLEGAPMATARLDAVEVFLTREHGRFAWAILVDGEAPLLAGADVNLHLAVTDAANAAAQALLRSPRRAA